MGWANPAAVTGPVLNMLRPTQTPNWRGESESRSPATGKATRAMDLVLSSDKEYVCLTRLHRDKGEEAIRRVMFSFQGRIYQMPPVRSAVKRSLRTREIHSIRILQIEGRRVLFRVACDSGTYIRTLCVDIGEALGVGANMEELRRVRSGSMREEDSVTLHDLKDAFVFWKEGDDRWLRRMLMPMEVLLEPLPKVVIKDSAVDAICHGANLAVVGIIEVDSLISEGETVALVTEKGEGVALAVDKARAKGMVEEKEGLAAETDRVFMETGTYHSMW